ncbi:FMN-binding protein [Alkaliphilus oremlandii]|uniref:FMN-binding domain protein n=1 Tax=Alkaliphilus oremlandii (strain OhILAs) TaxID=350688 RepID=A8MIK6_ALKOO|nr:FMN-binding protein [Alkaliphilus oremlandii]ABW19638.1 FMN-binding domain protein [Alkaliphilus oremlandii OhILAs]
MKKKFALALVFALTMGVFAGCSKPAKEAATGKFTDGVYEGVGEGFKGNIKVSVKVENGNIKTIDLLEIEDTPGIGDEGAKEVIAKIIEKQSTEVEVKSGATVSSNGTMEAVEVALGLKEAKVAEKPAEAPKEEEVKEEEKKEEEVKEEEKKEEPKKEEPKKEEPKKEEPKKEEPKKEEPKKEEPKKEEPKAADGFKDGSYVGKAEGFYGNIEMKVTISGGKISDVTINKMDETEGIGDVAVKKIAENAKAKNTGDLDTISGATVSSTGAITAIKNALSQAK